MSALSYQQCYEILALENQADWVQAESSYRKLVQQWHPDRYQGDDTADATRRYIDITKAFKKLRDFHKENNTLPFSSVDDATINKTSSLEKENKQEAYTKQKTHQSERLSTETGASTTQQASPRVTGANWQNQNRFRPSSFVVAIASVFFAGVIMILLFVTKLDKINSDRYRDEARLERISEHVVEQ